MSDLKPEHKITVDEQQADEQLSPLQRWAQRKQAVQTEAEQLENTPQTTESVQETGPAPVVELTDEDMPDLEKIDEKTDMSGFFSSKVSAELRQLALRKMFHLPVYNIRDGLNDYDDDYTTFTSLGNTVTAEMRYRQKVAERLQKEKEEKLQQLEAEAKQQLALEDTERESLAADSNESTVDEHTIDTATTSTIAHANQDKIAPAPAPAPDEDKTEES